MSLEPKVPPRWLRVGLLFPIQLGWIVMLAAGLRVTIGGSVIVGLLLIGVGLVTAFLGLRRLRAAVAAPPEAEYSGELRGPQFDYLIWTVIGAPMVLVLALLAFVLAGNGTGR